MDGMGNLNTNYLDSLSGYNPQSIGMGGLQKLPSYSSFLTSGADMPKVGIPKTGWGSLAFSDKAGLGLQGLSSLGGLVLGLKQLSMANKQFKSSEAFAKTNLANQVKSYNTALADRVRSRAWTETGSLAGADAEVEKNRMQTSY